MSQATVSVEQYQDLLRRSGLIEPPRLDQVLDEIQQEHGGRVTDSKILGEALVQAKVITAWQHEKLMRGRCKGFFMGRYKLLRHIAKGGMSDVLLAQDTEKKRIVALKVFPPQFLEKGSYFARFKREARTQHDCNHPNIVKAYEFGQEGKLFYMTLEYIDGPDFVRLVEQQGPLPVRQAAEYIRQACVALAYAHARNMIHRDIKPGNLMLNRQGQVKLLDLGLARVEDENGSLTVKHNENSLGTADYISPEQSLDSHNVDGRTDIYSLGGTFFFLLTGRPPYNEGTPVQRMMAHMNAPPPVVSDIRDDVPEFIVNLIRSMMAKKAKDRPPSMAAVHNALANWLGSSLDLLEEPPAPVDAAPAAPAPKPKQPAMQPASAEPSTRTSAKSESDSFVVNPTTSDSGPDLEVSAQDLPQINVGGTSSGVSSSGSHAALPAPARARTEAQGHSLAKIGLELGYGLALGGLVSAVTCHDVGMQQVLIGLAVGGGFALLRLAGGLLFAKSS